MHGTDGNDTTPASVREDMAAELHALAALWRQARPRDATPEDAELIRVCAKALAAYAWWQALNDGWEAEREDSAESDAAHDTIKRLVRQCHRLAERAALMPAHSRKGTAAKAKVMATYFDVDACGRLDRKSSHRDLLAWSIARDLLDGEGVPLPPAIAEEN